MHQQPPIVFQLTKKKKKKIGFYLQVKFNLIII